MLRQGARPGVPSRSEATLRLPSSRTLTQQIDRDIATLRETEASTIQAGFGFRVRSGGEGTSRLNEFTTPIEGEFSPGGYGRAKISITPTYVDAGRLDGANAGFQAFGTSAFNLQAAPRQQDFGVAPSVAYAYDDLAGDIGVTPIGFRVTNVVGGAQWTPKLTDQLTLRVVGEKRAIDDSVLSYAGARDTTTGETWGGVTRSRGRVNLEGDRWSGQLLRRGRGRGTHRRPCAAQHPESRPGRGSAIRFGATTPWRFAAVSIWSTSASTGTSVASRLVRVAISARSSFWRRWCPINFRHRVSDDLTYEIGGGVGVQSFRQRGTVVFPDDPVLQAALVAQQNNPATTIPGVITRTGGTHEVGIAGAFNASIDYRVTPNVHVGGRVAMEHAGTYTEGKRIALRPLYFQRCRAGPVTGLNDAVAWRGFLRALADEVDGVSGNAARDALLRGVGRRMAHASPLPPAHDTLGLALEMNDRIAAWGWGSVNLRVSDTERVLVITHRGLPAIGGTGNPPGTWLAAVLEGLYLTWLNALPGADRSFTIRRHHASSGYLALTYGRI